MPEEKMETKETKKRTPVKSFFKSFVDVKKWASYDEVSANAKTTFGLFRRLFSPNPEPTHKETYEEAIARLNMTEEQLLSKKKFFLYSALIYLVLALVLFFYLIYLLKNRHWFAAFFDLILVCLVSLTAYHEHFWYMQMQKKKLGCNFYDWISFVLWRTK